MATSRLTGVVLTIVLVMGATPLVADEPSQGAWPTARADSSDLSRGQAWVRNNPMLVSALVVSMGDAPPQQVSDYLGGFGATAVSLWQDGPSEVGSWTDGGARWLSWLAPDGTSVYWDPFLEQWETSGRVLGGLAPGLPGRIGYQVGDEPQTVAALEAIEEGIAAVRGADPDALVFTNFSYYAPEREAILARFVAGVDANIQVSGDYFYGPIHYDVLERFRDSALAKGVPYWQYLNAYIGAESGFERTHTVSDMRWQAMVGLTYGYTGHLWFLYQVAADGHDTATSWGGSALHQGLGDWEAPRSPRWADVAAINAQLANLGQAVTQLTSTDVRLIPADHPDATEPLRTTDWAPGAGSDPFLMELGPAPGQGPMDVVAGFFRDDDGQLYVMVQNGRHTHSVGMDEPPLPSADAAGTIEMAFDFTGAPYFVDRTRLEYLDPVTGVVRVLALTERPPPTPPVPDPAAPTVAPPPPPPEIWEAAVVLPPGGVFLFKYANTVPFRLGPDVEGVGLVDTATATWYLRRPGGVTTFVFGNPEDVPFLGDWDCDGIATPGLFRPADGFVYLRNTNTQGVADIEYFLGDPGDEPIVGDFDGDGCDTVSVYRRAEGRVFIVDRLGSGAQGVGTADYDYYFGDPADTAFAADFDGDGIDTIGLRRESTGLIYLRNSHSPGPADLVFYYADPADLGIFGDWDGNGTATPGIFRPEQARFYLRLSNDQGPADLDFLFGQEGWVPVAGVFG